MRRLIIASVVLVSAVGCGGGGDMGKPARGKDNAHASEALAVGKVAPDIVGEDIDSQPFKLSDYRGKVVVLDFWGNW